IEKHLQSVVFLTLFALILNAGSCAKKPVTEPDPSGEITNADINKWVLDSMKLWYYWNASIPSNVNLNQSPEVFFESILKRPDDRFSWIQNNEELRDQLSGVIKTSGLGLVWYKISDANAIASV